MTIKEVESLIFNTLGTEPRLNCVIKNMCYNHQRAEEVFLRSDKEAMRTKNMGPNTLKKFNLIKNIILDNEKIMKRQGATDVTITNDYELFLATEKRKLTNRKLLLVNEIDRIDQELELIDFKLNYERKERIEKDTQATL